MSQWIKCSDGIPFANTPVLVINENGDISISFWDDYEGWHTVSKITHWQALPEPPEEYL